MCRFPFTSSENDGEPGQSGLRSTPPRGWRKRRRSTSIGVQPPMIKLTFCLVRLPHLTRESFQRYWFETHAPLVASVRDALRIRRYVQLHSLPADVSENLRSARQGPEGFDGVAQ